MTRLLHCLPTLVLALAACGDVSESAPSAIDEPLRVSFLSGKGDVSRAQFFRGELPSGSAGPTVPNIDNLQRAVFQGQQGRKLTGVVDDTASAVAMKFDGIGTGYWV